MWRIIESYFSDLMLNFLGKVLKIPTVVVFEKVNAPDRRSGKIRNLKATSVQVRD